ncbi:MAG: 5-bromo-4-chloroindolyl phosphate hydrolysis family protein [Defluviitaleaceae bacterium]|nr:5-bromo-4-chloroindolyl phosphate hydrolysis family protein [Defluviitaleaceae bacterium]
MEDKKMFKEIRVKKINPIYAVGVAVLLYGLIFRNMHTFAGLLIAAAVAAVAYLLAKKILPERVIMHPLTETGALDKRCMEIIDAGIDYLEKLEAVHEKICAKSATALILSTQVKEITRTGRQMLEYTTKNPRTALELRTFIDYYFPTTLKLLDTYREMQEQAIKTDNMQAMIDKIHNVMDTIVAAFGKQLDSMFAEKKLDIKTDIEVLNTVIASEGLNEK